VSARCGEPLRDKTPCAGVVAKGWRHCPHHVLAVSARFARELRDVPTALRTVEVPCLGRPLDQLERDELLGFALFLMQTTPEVTK